MTVKKLLLGNEAIAEGALESGVEVVTGYPGTPSSEVITYLAGKVKRERLNVYVEWSVNEKVAIDVATAAAWAGKRALVTMKMAGLNVASDTLINVAYKGVKGGMVVYVADDPGTHAGCTEQDSRYYSLLSLVPILDPSDPMDAKNFTRIAFEVSERAQIPVILRATTNVSHTMGVVELGKPLQPLRGFDFKREPETYTTILSDRMSQHKLLLEKLERVNGLFDDFGLNPLKLKGKLGVIASGVSWTYVQEAMHTFGLDLSTLKIDSENPWPEKKVRKLIEYVDKILIVEEQEPLVESMVKRTMVNMNRIIPIIGKDDGTLPRVGEYDFEIVAYGLSKLMGHKIGFERGVNLDVERIGFLKPKRMLSFCPGCPHAATYYVINMAIRKLGLAKNDVIITGDIGCTSLGVYKPFESLWTEVTMGASVGLAHGFKVAGASKPVIATLGDSTFFHAGIPPLIDAVQHGSDITVIILDNRWTAMTGFQPNPITGLTALMEPTGLIDMAKLAEAIGAYVVIINPLDVSKSIDIVKETIARKGVKVIISREECTLQKVRREGRGIPYFVIEEECKKCGVCMTTFYCPAIFVDEGKYYIDQMTCTGCGVCAQICPFNAIEKVS